MTIDFSWSIDDWIALIKEFLQVVQEFFSHIGIDLFSSEGEEETTTA